jgi:hypothetical protein
MINDILGISISLLIMFLIRTPVFRYWSTVAKEKPFKSHVQFVVLSLMHLLFLCAFAIFYYFLIIEISFNLWNSTIPAFFLIQIFYYIAIIISYVFTYLIVTLINIIAKRYITKIKATNFTLIRKLYEKLIMNRLALLIEHSDKIAHLLSKLKLFKTTYFISEENEIDKELLYSVRFIKLKLLIAYLISGLLVISSASNELLLKTKILTTSVVASSIFNRDIQTYSNFFIMSVLPLALQYFIKNGTTTRHEP